MVMVNLAGDEVEHSCGGHEGKGILGVFFGDQDT